MIGFDALFELLRARRSIRKFQDRPVARDLIDKCLEAACWAPSNHNRQGWRFIVLQDRAAIGRLAGSIEDALRKKIAENRHLGEQAPDMVRYAVLFKDAPVVIAVWHRKPHAFSRSLLAHLPCPELVSGEPLSSAMAVQNLCLAATALGLGTCILSAPLIAREELLRELDAPPAHEPTCLVALGYPAETPAAPPRKNLDQVAEFR